MKTFLAIAVAAIAAFGMAQPGQGRGGQRGGRQGNSLVGLLQRTDVQAELKITEEQKGKLAALTPARGQGGPGGGGGGAGFDPEAMRKAQAEREKGVMAVLDAGQAKRLKELFVQRAGNSAVMREDIQKELGLSTDQVAKITDLQAKQREANQAIMEKVRNQELDRAASREAQAKNTKVLNDEIGKVLTEKQAAALKAMGGAPFKFEDPQ